MNKILFAISAIMIALVMACAIAPANAQFAQFQAGSSGDPFSFTNSGSSSTFDGTSVPISFAYLVPNGTGTTSIIPATLTLSSVVDGTATKENLGGTVYDFQNLQDVNVTITADSPINGQSNLLTLTGADATLAGQNQKSVLSLSDTPTTLDYTSSFLNFAPGADSFSLSFNTSSSVGIASDDYLKSLTAGGASGSFAGTVSSTLVPESSGAITMVAGLLLLCGLGVWRYRRAQ